MQHTEHKTPMHIAKKKKIPFNFPIPHKPRNHYHMQIPKDDEEKKKKNPQSPHKKTQLHIQISNKDTKYLPNRK